LPIFKYRDLTSVPPLKEAVLGVFDLAEIVAGGSKNKLIDGFCAKFFAKSVEVVSLKRQPTPIERGVVTPTDPKGKEGEILLSRALGGL
jgi:hypothetical protein